MSSSDYLEQKGSVDDVTLLMCKLYTEACTEVQVAKPDWLLIVPIECIHVAGFRPRSEAKVGLNSTACNPWPDWTCSLMASLDIREDVQCGQGLGAVLLNLT